MRKYIKKCICVIAMILLIGCMEVLPVGAEQTGQLTIYIGNPGGKVTIYRVATSKLKFVNGFDAADVSLDDLTDSSLPGKLQAAVTSDTVSVSASAGSDGKVHFRNLQMGLYLVVQTQAVSGYEPFASFLVKIPIKDGQNWNYDVDASPKMELIPKKDITPPPTPELDTEPDTESDTERLTPKPNPQLDTEKPTPEPDMEKEPIHKVTRKDNEEYDQNSSSNGQPNASNDKQKIPQTGQLVWPIPVLAFIGLVLILLGKRWKDDKK